MADSSARPFSVNLYSTPTGGSGMTVRTTNPSASSSLRRSASICSIIAPVNRKDFGLNWNQALETGGVLVGDQVTISVDLELVRTSD